MTTPDPSSVIQLPRLTHAELGTLMQELVSTAEAVVHEIAHPPKDARTKGKEPPNDTAPLPEEFPDHVTDALVEMRACRGALMGALRAVPTPDRYTPTQRTLDLRADAGWRCVQLTYRLGAERARMRGDTEAATQCETDEAAVLPNGLLFINPIGRTQYTASEVSIGVLEGAEIAGRFQKLPGGEALLRELRSIHDAYGREFNITRAAPREAVGDGSDPVANAFAATREYVSAVVGTVRRKDPRTRALAEALRQPLGNYGGSSAAKAAPSTTPKPPDAPKPPEP